MYTKACCEGFIDEGTPKGKMTTFAGLPAYISVPDDHENAHEINLSGQKLIILATDIFGYDTVNPKLMCDHLAQEGGFVVIMPDILQGQAVTLSLLQTMETLSTKSKKGWIGTIIEKTSSIPKVVGHMLWFLKNHTPGKSVADAQKVIDEAKKQGVKSIGMTGYCWGGTVVVRLLSRRGNIQAGVISHPGPLSIPSDIEAISSPVLFNCASEDFYFPQKHANAANKILEERKQKNPEEAVDYKFVTYPNTVHGFAGRGNMKDEHICTQRKKALYETLEFLKTHV